MEGERQQFDDFFEEEYEIGEEDFVDENFILKQTSFENIEIDIPDDINLDDLNEVEGGLPIPSLKFCDEKEVPCLVATNVDKASKPQKKPQQTFVCKHCGKCYIRKSFFERHEEQCITPGKCNFIRN